MAFNKTKAKDSSSGPGSRSFRRFESRRDSVGFPWSGVSGRLIAAALDCATANGVAVIFGSAQGGRGVVVTCFTEPDRIKEYASTVGEFHELLIALIEEFQGQSQDYLAVYQLDTKELLGDD